MTRLCFRMESTASLSNRSIPRSGAALFPTKRVIPNWVRFGAVAVFVLFTYVRSLECTHLSRTFPERRRQLCKYCIRNVAQPLSSTAPTRRLACRTHSQDPHLSRPSSINPRVCGFQMVPHLLQRSIPVEASLWGKWADCQGSRGRPCLPYPHPGSDNDPEVTGTAFILSRE